MQYSGGQSHPKPEHEAESLVLDYDLQVRDNVTSDWVVSVQKEDNAKRGQTDRSDILSSILQDKIVEVV